MAARQRKTSVGDDVPAESTEIVPESATLVKLPVDNMEVTFLNDEIEVTYSRSWDLAVVQYEKESLFHSFKVKVSADADLIAVGNKLCDMMTELQEADLVWARSMTNNRGSLITKILPTVPE